MGSADPKPPQGKAPADEAQQQQPPAAESESESDSTRQRVAAIASRFASLAGNTSNEAANKVSEAASDASAGVAKTVEFTRNAAATQTAGLLHAMALTTKPPSSSSSPPSSTSTTTSSSSSSSSSPSDSKPWWEYESPLHARRRLAAIESPLHARRRLAAIANQLGLATSSSKQAPSLFKAITSSPPSSSSSTMDFSKLPRYKDLPSEGGWKACAWKVWGANDELGTINLLTDEVVLKAAKDEIQTGRAVSLNWPLHLPTEPYFSRRAVTHKAFAIGGPHVCHIRDEYIKNFKERNPDSNVVNNGDEGIPVSDEHLEMNTQSGSQWDGLRHFGHLGLNAFYGGASRSEIQKTFDFPDRLPATPQELNTPEMRQRNKLGIHNLAKHGICGRGVLLDVFEYLSNHGLGDVERNYEFGTWSGYGGGKGYDPRTGFRITLADLEATAKHQKVEIRPGDILLIRSGFTARYYSLSAEERAAWAEPVRPDGKEGMEFAGVEQNEQITEWLWNNHVAAVAGDCPSFECRPSAKEGDYMIHQTLLGMWGMPIGEMFDLEELSATCKNLGRWSFYFGSWPLMNYGGIASTANASATF
ncbi:hypothetical protein BCV70DRAFT_197896 [Testicularia cyperi]|uniref:Cyclase n=1 Tax=Testicularia cyperi TaxID=1882483 RepID=A0A317XZH4_9BASI|nr:hypothetical protein BCV70DRAFT_197896 [Testicularia cyperi]